MKLIQKVGDSGSMKLPPALHPGDKIAILSPATSVKAHYVGGAVATLRRLGYRPEVMPHALGPGCGTFACSDDNRLRDLRDALRDDEVKVILCARGGYGCIHLLSAELEDMVRENPKWLVGFSDISALHALWQKAGVMSLHCSMAKQLAHYGVDWQVPEIRQLLEEDALTEIEKTELRNSCEAMLAVISNSVSELEYILDDPAKLHYDGSECNSDVLASGKLAGGNLAVLNGLAATPWDILSKEFLKGRILFLEDVGEKIYQVERMLTRLRLSGALQSCRALVFGWFTDYHADKNFPSMEDMINFRMHQWGIDKPYITEFPAGHRQHNLPLLLGAETEIRR